MYQNPNAKPGDSSSVDYKMILGMVGVGVLVLFAIPLGIGATLYYLGRNHFGRREWVVVTVAGVLGTVATFSTTFGSYTNWMTELVFGGDRFAVPIVSVLVLSVFVCGLIGLLIDTPMAVSLQNRLMRRQPVEIFPDEREIQRVAQAKPPLEGPVVTLADHSLADGAPMGSRRFPVGIDRDGKPLYVGEDEIKTHAVVLGSTGSGKTEALKNLAGNLLDLGWQVVTIDLKEDTAPGGFRDFLRDYASSHALYFQDLLMSTPSKFWFNPLDGMTPDEAINAILSLQTFDDGYWQAINRTMIGQIVTLFFDAHRVDPERFPAPTMFEIGRTLRHPDLKAATKEMRAVVTASIPGRSEENFSALGKPSDAERQSASGLGARIINMYESEAGRMVLRPGEARECLDVTLPGISYIGLNTLGLSELARVVSTSVLLRLAALAGARTTGAVAQGTTRIAVIIDEANWIDRPGVQNLLSRARSAGVSVILATQGANDWNDENGQDWEKIVNNVNVGIIMRQGGPESAELCAEYIGKTMKTSMTTQIVDGGDSGRASMREVEDYWVGPDKLRLLGIGQAIIRVGSPQFRLSWVKMNLRDPEMLAGGGRREAIAPQRPAPAPMGGPPTGPGGQMGPTPGPLDPSGLPGRGQAFPGSGPPGRGGPPTGPGPGGPPMGPGPGGPPMGPGPGGPPMGPRPGGPPMGPRPGGPPMGPRPAPQGEPAPRPVPPPNDDGWVSL